jgi:hypothetical protein
MRVMGYSAIAEFIRGFTMVRRYSLFLLTIALIVSAGSTLAQTNVSGTIATNTTWGIKGSPFIIIGPTTVDKGVTLTIGPGVAVQFDANVALEVVGQLVVNGGPDANVTFASTGSKAIQWAGIHFTSPDASEINHARFADGVANGTGSEQLIGGAILVNNAIASVTLNDCVFEGIVTKGGGAVAVASGVVNLNGCIIAGNSTDGDGAGVLVQVGEANVTNCTFFGNVIGGVGGTGLAIIGDAQATVTNSIFWGGVPIATDLYTKGGPITLGFSSLSGDKPPVGVTVGVGVIFGDPMLVAPTKGDYSLTIKSPCIDAGNPKGVLDPDGTIADMGAIFFDQTPPPPTTHISLPTLTIREDVPSLTVDVTATLDSARSAQFAFTFNSAVISPATFAGTAFDGLLDATVLTNINGDTVFVAMAASEELNISDSILVRMTFDNVGIGVSPLTFIPEYVDVDETTPPTVNGQVEVEAIPYGDVTEDGSVSALDAAKILRRVVHIIFNINTELADVSGNSKVTAYDAALVLHSVVNPAYVYPVRGGALIKPASTTPPSIAWEPSGDAWQLVASDPTGILSGEFELRVSDGAAISGSGTLLQNRQGGVVSVAFARMTDTPILLRVNGVTSAPELLSAALNDVPVTLSATPQVFSLAQNAPNPFNPSTTIRFTVAQAAPVNLAIYTVSGQLVRTLVNTELAAGEHDITWDGTDHAGRNVASGMYIYRLATDEHSLIRKAMLVR